MSLRVGVAGAGGRMGQAVCHAVAAEPDLVLTAGIDPSFAGIDIGEVAGVEGGRFDVVPSVEVVTGDQVDVMVDFTDIDAARANIDHYAHAGIHAVIGTSGFTEDDHKQIASLFTRSNCLIAPNFAIGAVLMMRFAALAAPYFDTAEIIELHHDGKVDSPSGTSIAMAERMAMASSRWAVDPTRAETLTGARGAKGPAGIPVHSVRMRGMTAHHEVVFGTTGQTLTLRHDSYDRSSFMPGVVLAVRRIGQAPGLSIGLDAILDS